MRFERPTPSILRPLSILALASLLALPVSAALPEWLADAPEGGVASLRLESGVRLGECASVHLSRPHVTVSQWIDGQVYHWKEIPQPDGSVCTLLLTPETRPLTVGQAAALRNASGGGRVTAASTAPTADVVRRPSRSARRPGAVQLDALDRSFDREARRLLGEPRGVVRVPLDRPADRPPAARESDAATRLAAPLVFGADDRIRTTNTTVFPYNTVVFVESEFPDGSFVFSTGVLVSPYTVLTTALALRDPVIGEFASSVLVVPGQTQTAEGVLPLIEPYGTQYGVEIEVPQSWVDSADAASSYGAVFLADAFSGISTFYPIAFDLVPSGNVQLIAYDESPQGELESFAQWRRTGTLVGSDDLFVDHRMDDDFGAVGAPLATAGSNQRLFALNCCVADDDSSNVGVRFTSDIADQINGWLAFEPDKGPLEGPPLFVNDDRFRIVINWRDFKGGSGAAQPAVLTDDTGYFTIFDVNNVEVVIKVLDACAISDFYWVFAAGLTNLEIELEVTDTQTQSTKRFSNQLGVDFQPILDTRAFATCP